MTQTVDNLDLTPSGFPDTEQQNYLVRNFSILKQQLESAVGVSTTFTTTDGKTVTVVNGVITGIV